MTLVSGGFDGCALAFGSLLLALACSPSSFSLFSSELVLDPVCCCGGAGGGTVSVVKKSLYDRLGMGAPHCGPLLALSGFLDVDLVGCKAKLIVIPLWKSDASLRFMCAGGMLKAIHAFLLLRMGGLLGLLNPFETSHCVNSSWFMIGSPVTAIFFGSWFCCIATVDGFERIPRQERLPDLKITWVLYCFASCRTATL